MLLNLIELLGGLVLIIKGGEWFVESSVQIGRLLRMPRVVIGSTLVSLATTSPELGVSLTSGAVGESSLAVGNAIGSCICNIALILGTTATLKDIDVHPSVVRRSLVAMSCFGVLLFVMTLDLHLARWQGWLLIIAGFGYFGWDFWRNWHEREPEKVAAAKDIQKGIAEHTTRWAETRVGTYTLFVAGVVVVVLGSRLLVEGATGVAARLGISPIVIGLTIVAIGTSLPEFITAITSSRKAVSDLSVGNVIGANIANLTFVLGAAAAMQDVSMSRLTQVVNFPAMMLAIAGISYFLLAHGGLKRWHGILLLVCYAGYLALLLLLTAGQRAESP